MRSVMSGASKVLPSELAYFLNIMSRTSSTKSSSLIWTRVADAPGRLTHILRRAEVAMLDEAEEEMPGRTTELSATVGLWMSVFITAASVLSTRLCWRWREKSVGSSSFECGWAVEVVV